MALGAGKKSIQKVHQLLSDLGVDRPESLSNCLKTGIINSCITLKRPAEDPEGNMLCRILDILYQPDYGGRDYEDGGVDAPFKCANEDCGLGIYVTDLCSGEPHFDSSKFHNHCQACPLFDVCIDEVHCGDHYFSGGM